MLRILVADDYELVRRAICGLLETETGWEICGEASSGREAVKMAVRCKPDVVVLDLSMPELNGLEATREILRHAPQTNVLILTMHDPQEILSSATAAGARACVSKASPHLLISAIRDLLRNDFPRPLDPGISIEKSAEDLPEEELTQTEREIVRLLAGARSDTEIAAALSISVETIEVQRAQIMRKLTANSLLEVVQYAVRRKLVEVKPSTSR